MLQIAPMSIKCKLQIWALSLALLFYDRIILQGKCCGLEFKIILKWYFHEKSLPFSKSLTSGARTNSKLLIKKLLTKKFIHKIQYKYILFFSFFIFCSLSYVQHTVMICKCRLMIINIWYQ